MLKNIISRRRSSPLLKNTLKNLRWAKIWSTTDVSSTPGIFLFYGRHQLSSVALQKLFLQQSKCGFAFYRLSRSWAQLFLGSRRPSPTYAFLATGNFYCLYWPSLELCLRSRDQEISLRLASFVYFSGHFFFDMDALLPYAVTHGPVTLCYSLRECWEPLLSTLSALCCQLVNSFPPAGAHVISSPEKLETS